MNNYAFFSNSEPDTNTNMMRNKQTNSTHGNSSTSWAFGREVDLYKNQSNTNIQILTLLIYIHIKKFIS